MIENRIKKAWADGKPVISGWLQIPSGIAAEVMAAQGYDALTIDLQHGIIDYQASVGMMQAMRASAVTPLVRVPWLDPSAIMRVLDAGAYGVICPMISTRSQAEELVSYVRYPPRGIRSMGPTRANYSAGANYAAEADDQLLCFAMIETREAFDNVEAIVSTPGLDAVYIGPADLTIGLTGQTYPIGVDREEPEMVDAIKRILAASHDAGIRAGIACLSPAYAARAVGWGFDFVALSTDLRMLASAAATVAAETRKLIAAPSITDHKPASRSLY